ncbi:hypothetical protein RhiJN_07924 [Ceratobasidium sp. AG-Ba]|nr:hypothetical protein RhiJN_07924 [Ceratobasidium sp. AG-Ba]QRW08736.1 hypothetical protein RhiLY_07735 [Ceratobasidium sp. AG-Ba]
MPPRSRSQSPSAELLSSQLGIDSISEADYFRKSPEFRIWLRDEKGKYFDELTGERARHYFRKFAKAWNRGKLSESIYTGNAATKTTQPASSNTAYRWSFASGDSKVNMAELKSAREAVRRATYGDEPVQVVSSSLRSPIGPTLPPGSSLSSSDRTLQREAEIENAKQERRVMNKRTRERLEDEDGGIGPKQVGREGTMEKKRARREEDRAMRDRKEDGGLEIGEDFLMGAGSSDSFRAAIAKRDAARARWAEKKQVDNSGTQERRAALRAKEAETMAMFQNMAKERFG